MTCCIVCALCKQCVTLALHNMSIALHCNLDCCVWRRF